jgi:DNA-binding transcriptional MerR regulator
MMLDESFDACRPLYTITVAAEMAGCHERTLMLYEVGGLVKPARTRTNRRRYSQADILEIRLIQTLTHGLGLNLAGVRHLLSLFAAFYRARQQPPNALKSAFAQFQEISGLRASRKSRSGHWEPTSAGARI